MIYINGKYFSDQEAKIESNDRGFLLGDGIFETMRVYGGKIFCFNDHYDRLKNSADYLDIPFTMPPDEVKQIIEALLEKNELSNKDASVRLTLTRGSGPRGLLPPINVHTTLMLTAAPFTMNAHKPLTALISEIRRNEFSPLSNIKSLCYLDNIIARNSAAKNGFDECIMLNTKGIVACASVANVFIVTQDKVITPRLEDGVLPGITRKMVINICNANNITVDEEAISESDLMHADEVFFTNSLIEIQPVAQINNKLINEGKIGEITLKLQKFYKTSIDVSSYDVDNSYVNNRVYSK